MCGNPEKTYLSRFIVSFHFFVQLNTVFNPKLNFKLKIDPKTATFKNLEEVSQKLVATLLYLFKKLLKLNEKVIGLQHTRLIQNLGQFVNL